MIKPFETLTLGDVFHIPFGSALPDCNESMGGHYNPCICAQIYPKLSMDKRSVIFIQHELGHSYLDGTQYMCYVRGIARRIYISLFRTLSQLDVNYARLSIEDPEVYKLNKHVADVIRRVAPVQELFAVWLSLDFFHVSNYLSKNQVTNLQHRYMERLKQSYPEDDIPNLYKRLIRLWLKRGEKNEDFPFVYALNGPLPFPDRLEKDDSNVSSVRVDPLARFKRALTVMEAISQPGTKLHNIGKFPEPLEFFRLRKPKLSREAKPCWHKSNPASCKVNVSGEPCRLEKKLQDFSRAVCEYRDNFESMSEEEFIYSNPLIKIDGDKIWLWKKSYEEQVPMDRIFYESMRQQLVHRKGLVCPFWPSHCHPDCTCRGLLSMAWRVTCQDYADENWQQPDCLL